ncbi:Stp1/IreP family PP2C-type Ser/Thr phosphatase [Phototrophicus methaneseepsis]|uniref:Stp1/IreP family PP2C-type Ser/Thr phosphatase n=1 Tax=Phototrophicus methaneseepsis TaxID=2710758 RepID=A0A7S8IFX5_9CHLR|nr:Stp1/IreP family PP2C-type Ser/Thr phosphatase [Phototrophicus methaneseepsis]QPC84057.1 Stp1/IreP family PP2C-type Ser/Thr phosphatase [Phototrophicus methaneseepsis]
MPEWIHDVGWHSDKGMGRENNQDSLAATTIRPGQEADNHPVGIYVIADGMGGHENGEVASQIAVNAVVEHLVNNLLEDKPEAYETWLHQAVSAANKRVVLRQNDAQSNMGTTLLAALVVGADAYIANVGDSRAYIFSEDTIKQVTVDQSFAQMLATAGAIAEAEIEQHPYRNVLTQSIGQDDPVDEDLFKLSLDQGDTLILCSDGLYKEVDQEDMQTMAASDATAQDIAEALVKKANDAGGHDNIAVIVVKIRAA